MKKFIKHPLFAIPLFMTILYLIFNYYSYRQITYFDFICEVIFCYLGFFLAFFISVAIYDVSFKENFGNRINKSFELNEICDFIKSGNVVIKKGDLHGFIPTTTDYLSEEYKNFLLNAMIYSYILNHKNHDEIVEFLKNNKEESENN